MLCWLDSHRRLRWKWVPTWTKTLGEAVAELLALSTWSAEEVLAATEWLQNATSDVGTGAQRRRDRVPMQARDMYC